MENRYQECRNAIHISLKKAGRLIGCADSTLSQYEHGHRTPDIVTITRMAEVYGVSIDYLVGKDVPPLPATTEEPEETQNEPQVAAQSGPQLDDYIVSALTGLSDQEIQNVLAFVAGLRSSRALRAVSSPKGSSSPAQ